MKCLNGKSATLRHCRNFILVAFSLVFLTSCGTKLPDALAPGATVPYTRFTYLDGGYDSLASFRGKKVAILFWAKWCSKSRRSITAFNDLAAEYKGKAAFITVSLDKFKDEAEVKRYLDSQSFNQPVHVFSGNGPDDEAVLAFRAFEIPIAFLVDEKGTVAFASHDMGELSDQLAVW